MQNKQYLFNQEEVQSSLNNFFQKEKSTIFSFGKTVNQTFEAYVFASVIKWYETAGWKVCFINPRDSKGRAYFKLKFSTRGAPQNYSYVICEGGNERIQIHHQIRIATKHHKYNRNYRANICCDVAIIKETCVDYFNTDTAVESEKLISFAEAKHMSAFAELLASFIGVVHELKPDRLRKIRIKKYMNNHLPPFLYVSGILYATAKGIRETIERRKFDIDIYSFDEKLI